MRKNDALGESGSATRVAYGSDVVEFSEDRLWFDLEGCALLLDLLECGQLD